MNTLNSHRARCRSEALRLQRLLAAWQFLADLKAEDRKRDTPRADHERR